MSFEIACLRLAPGSLLVSLVTTLLGTGKFTVATQISIDGGPALSIPMNGYLVVGSLAEGEHLVRLSANAWCSGNRGPLAVTIPSGGSATLRFKLMCGVFFP